MLDCNQKYTQKITFFSKYLTAIADLYKSVKRVDPSCFIAVDNRDTVIQWLTDGELAASSSQREHQSPFQLSASLRSIDLDYHLQHLSSFFTAEKAATSYSLFVRGCRAQFTHLITNHHICCVQEGRVGTFFSPLTARVGTSVNVYLRGCRASQYNSHIRDGNPMTTHA